MQNPDDSRTLVASKPSGEDQSPDDNAPSFPFLTKLWMNGNVIAIVLGLIALVGSISILGRMGNSLGIIVGIFAGAFYGAMIWFLIKIYSEIAGVWLNMEESARITADILSRMEANGSSIVSEAVSE